MTPSLIKILILGLVLNALACAAERPNILVIMADDLGYGDTGFTGSSEIKTPHLDALAQGGIICENGFVTHPFCSPSRAGFMTGRYQARFGFEADIPYSPFDAHSGLPVSEKTFATRVKKAGYRTGIIGKWHLGAAPPFHPNNRGFDHFYGFFAGGHYYWPNSVNIAKPLTFDDGRLHYGANAGSFRSLVRNGQETFFKKYLTAEFTDEAVRFVKEGEKPFCLFLSYNAPHTPLEAPKRVVEKYKHIAQAERRTYAAMIDVMDQGVGKVVQALKESGKFENTLIFFLSDNGGLRSNSPTVKKSWASNHPYRSGKGSLLEGGIHVPFFLHWPAAFPKPRRYQPMVSSLDISATIVHLVKGDLSGARMDGKNLLPFLRGEKEGVPHQALFFRVDGDGWAVRTPQAKLLFDLAGDRDVELYDLENDPYETENLAESRPELRAQLATLWNSWNQYNIPNRYLRADIYLRQRLKMYQDLKDRLNQRAVSKKNLVVE